MDDSMFGIALERWDKHDEGRQGWRMRGIKKRSLCIDVERRRQVSEVCE
jgi:hypothetical protein